MINAYPQNQYQWAQWGLIPPQTPQAYSQMPQQMPMNQQPVQPDQGLPTIHRVVWVQGREAAKSLQLAPNENVMALDSESDHFYLVRAGQDGKPKPLEVFSFTKDDPDAETANYVTRKEFDDLKASLEALKTPTASEVKEGE